ncbi:hypothetical protein [uncultured Paracoccus sp.]|nr:hypothetical protein [uncultured Paracoccus sp.]
MQNVVAVSFLAIPVALMFALLFVPINQQRIFWFALVPLAILALAGVI